MSMRPGKAKGPSVSPTSGGGGGGNLSGTLTPNVSPVASAPHTLVDGAISYDTLTANIAIAEQKANLTSAFGVRAAGLAAGGAIPEISVQNARGGSVAAPGNVGNGDQLGRVAAYGGLGGNYVDGGGMYYFVDGVPGGGIVPVMVRMAPMGPGGAVVPVWDARTTAFQIYQPLVLGKASRAARSVLGIVAGLVAVDANLADIFTLEVTGNCTISNPTNLDVGSKFIIRFKMLGNFTVAWGTQFNFVGGAPTIDTTLNSYTYLGFVWNEDSLKLNCVGTPIGPFT